MKRLISFLLALIILMSCAALAASDPLIYRASDADGHFIYLLGTIHYGYENMYPLSETVLNAFAESDFLAVEIDLNAALSPEDAAILANALSYPDGDGLSLHLSPVTFSRLQFNLHLSGEELDRMRPLSALMRAEEAISAADPLLGVDRQLLALAAESGKPVVSLETAAEHYGIMPLLPDSVIEYSLSQVFRSTLRTAAYRRQLHSLIDAWRKGDERNLKTLCTTNPELFPAELQEDVLLYMRLLENDRNLAMLEKAEGYLADDQIAFIAVGAAHILADDGLVNQLIARGYTVERMSPEQKENVLYSAFHSLFSDRQ